MKKLSDKIHLEICEDYKSGMGCVIISKKYNIRPNSVDYVLKKYNIKKRTKKETIQKYVTIENYFEKIDTEERAYFLGFLYADGNIYNNVISMTLHRQDETILQKLLNCLCPNRKLYSIKTQPNHACLHIENKKITNDLRSLGMFERKSLTLKFPTEKQVPNYLLNHFIRGYFDGDGSIYVKSRDKQWGITIISSFDFCSALKSYLNHQNIPSFISQNDKIYRLVISKQTDILKFYKLIYPLNTSIYLERKYNKFQIFIKEKDWNKLNQPKSSQYKGVIFLKREQKWMAYFKKNKKQTSLGYFKTEEEAFRARQNYDINKKMSAPTST